MDSNHSCYWISTGQIAAWRKQRAKPKMSTKRPDIQDIGCCVSNNYHLLQELLEGPKQKAELADELGVSKHTVYRWADELTRSNLVGRTSEGYRLTVVGRHVLERYLGMLESMEGIYETRRTVNEVPAEVLPPRDALEEARTVLPDGHPEQLRSQFCEWVLDGHAVRGMFPHVSYRFVERLCEELQTGGITIDVALAPDTLGYLQDCCPEACSSVRESDSSVVVETADLPSFGLVVVDEPRREAGLVVYTGDGYVSGFLRAPTESAYRWGDEQLAKYTGERLHRSAQKGIATERSS